MSLLPSPRGLRGRLAGQPSPEVYSSSHHHQYISIYQYQDVYTTSRYLGLIFVNNFPHNHTPPPPRNHHHHHRLHDHHLNLQNQDVFTTSPQRRLQIVLSKVQVRPHCITRFDMIVVQRLSFTIFRKSVQSSCPPCIPRPLDNIHNVHHVPPVHHTQVLNI